MTTAATVLVGAHAAPGAPVFAQDFGLFSNPRSLTVDQSSGDVYVVDAGAATVQKFDAGGNAVPFSALGTNVLDGAGAAEPDQTPENGFDFASPQAPGAAQVAVDESGGPSDGSIYVTSPGSRVVDVFAPSGTYVGQLTGSGIPFWGSLDTPCGVAVDADGGVYVADARGGGAVIQRFQPVGGPVTDADWDSKLVAFAGQGVVCGLALDTAGHVYTVSEPSGPLTQYKLSQFSSDVPGVAQEGVLVDPVATAAAVDPGTNDVYVDHGNDIAQYDVSGLLLGTFAGSDLFDSHGVAVRSSTGDVYATDSSATVAKLFTAPPPASPTVAHERTDQVHSTSARLIADVGPQGFATTYHVEYGSTDCSTSACTATPEKSAGLGFDPVTAAQQVTGLSPDTVYHYRIVAENVHGLVAGPDVTFRTFPTSASFQPPDGRGYERVSPADTNGFPVAPARVRSVTPSGDRVLFQATRGAAPGTGAGVGGDVLRAARGPQGWSSASLFPPTPVNSQFFGDVPAVQAVSADLTQNLVATPAALTPDAPPVASQGFGSLPKNLYLQDSDGAYHVLNPRTADPGIIYEGSTADFGHVVFSSFRPQLDNPDIVDFQSYPYEWVDGELRLVSVLPDGSVPQSKASIGGSSGTAGLQHAISADGARVFFHVDAPVNDGSFGQIYVRENGQTTTHVSASQSSVQDPNGPLPPLFLAAEAAHGDTVLFSSCEKLTDDSTASSNPADPSGGDCGVSPGGGSEADKSDLYLYDVSSGELTDITTLDKAGADFAGLIGASDDLGRIYFTARGVLASGATSGKMNIYLWDHGTTTFVGAGLSADITGSGGDPLKIQDSYNWEAFGSALGLKRAFTARVSASGRYLLFTSRADLSTYDNSAPDCPLDETLDGIGRQCTEVYRFDAATSRLDCLSCPSSNSRSTGDSRLLSGIDFFNVDKNELPNNLLEDGTSYFETPNRLLAEDTNGAVDVYQYRNGQLRLISDGGDAGGGRFGDVTPSAGDVFFTTSARLVTSDKDSLVDLYDARVGGGFPDDPAAPRCSEDSCQGSPSGRPTLVDPSSSLVPGAGDAGSRSSSYSVRGISRAQRLSFARTGQLTLAVKVSRGGKVSVVGKATVGGRSRIVAHGAKTAKKAGTVKVLVKLTVAARKRLAQAGTLKLRLSVGFSKATKQEHLSITLARPGEKRRSARGGRASTVLPSHDRKDA